LKVFLANRKKRRETIVTPEQSGYVFEPLGFGEQLKEQFSDLFDMGVLKRLK
jgi:hypothetical protein